MTAPSTKPPDGSAPASPDEPTSEAPTRAELIEDLRQLIAALDRRVPHLERTGETDIARDAAALRTRALKRIEALERSDA